MTCDDCIHSYYGWCKETEGDFYKIRRDNPACEDFAPKAYCGHCIWCTKRDSRYYCKHHFTDKCVKHDAAYFSKSLYPAHRDKEIWPPRKGA